MSLHRQVIKRALNACFPAERLLVRGRRSVSGNKRAISITFDDGPDPRWTPPLLDRLADLGVRATFFVVGAKVAAHPALVKRIATEGHELGNHTWSHAEPNSITTGTFSKEVSDTADLLLETCGAICRLTRPPHGKVTWSKLRALWRLNQTAVLWNVDPRDYLISQPEEMESWAANYQPQHGDILLFHDNQPYGEVALTEMSRQGIFDQFSCVTVSDWLPKGVTGTSPAATMSARNNGVGEGSSSD